MTTEHEKLISATTSAMLIQFIPLRDIAFMKLANLAHSFGYSYESFQKDQIWRTYQELETIKPSEPVETRVFASIKLIPCKYCGNEFKEKGNKIFCCEGCRHKYHNEIKLKDGK